MGLNQSKKSNQDNTPNWVLFIQVNDPNGIYTETLKCKEKKKSTAGTFTYYALSNKLSKLLDKELSFTVTKSSNYSEKEERIFISDNYRMQREKYSIKTNIINKTTYIDYNSLDHHTFTIRHDENTNPVEFIITGDTFKNY